MPITVAVDDREPAAVVEALRSHPEVDAIDRQRLVAGDVVVGDVGIERKTLADYVSTLIGRGGPDLYDQVQALTDAYAHSYLLLEAELPADGEEGVPAAAVRGSVASITARFETPVLPCSDLVRLVDLAVRLGLKHASDPSTPALPAGSVTRLDAPTPERMYGCIDGIGPELAARLHDAYPTVAALVEASTEELLELEGIGPKRADAIRAAFRDPS